MNEKVAVSSCNSAAAESALTPTNQPKLLRRRLIIAAALSLVTSGLGHLYCGRPGKAILLYLLHYLTLTIAGVSGLYSSVYFLAILAAEIGFRIYVVLDSALTARRVKAIEPRRYNKWYVYAAVVVAHIGVWESLKPQLIPLKTYRMPSQSMEPALLVGDCFICDLAYYKDRDPGRGDLVVFPFPKNPEQDRVGRVIAVGGDTVEIENKRVFLNGKPAEDSLARLGPCKEGSAPEDYGANMPPVQVPKGFLFVMGDNRNCSFDSRFWGGVDVREVKGRALYIYWSRSPDVDRDENATRHMFDSTIRWNRIGMSLTNNPVR